MHDYFDVAWITKLGTKFTNINKKLFIENSKGNWANISICTSGYAEILLSDGRSYNFDIKEENGIKYICDSNSVISFMSNDLSPKGYIIYFYDIKPKKSGIFNTETIVRLYDSDYGHIQDISFVIPIEIKESLPKFEITPKPNKLVPICNNPINSNSGYVDISYGINYVGGSSEPICRDNSIEFDSPNGSYFYYVDQNGIRNDSLCNHSFFKIYSDFYRYETKEIPIRVFYPHEGIFSLPGIWINGIHYTFEDDKITVESFYSKYMQYIFLLIAIFSVVVSSLEVYITRETCSVLKPNWKHIVKHFGAYLGILLILILLMIIWLAH